MAIVGPYNVGLSAAFSYKLAQIILRGYTFYIIHCYIVVVENSIAPAPPCTDIVFSLGINFILLLRVKNDKVRWGRIFVYFLSPLERLSELTKY